MGDCFGSVAICGVRDAWVEVVELDAESFAALEIVEESVVGLGCAGLVCVGEVDEVAAVGDDVFGLVVGVVFTVRVEGICVLGL